MKHPPVFLRELERRTRAHQRRLRLQALFLAVAAFGTSRILGPDRYIESYDLGGETVVERYPRLESVLG